MSAPKHTPLTDAERAYVARGKTGENILDRREQVLRPRPPAAAPLGTTPLNADKPESGWALINAGAPVVRHGKKTLRRLVVQEPTLVRLISSNELAASKYVFAKIRTFIAELNGEEVFVFGTDLRRLDDADPLVSCAHCGAPHVDHTTDRLGECAGRMLAKQAVAP